jgi:hypothetical protein
LFLDGGVAGDPSRDFPFFEEYLSGETDNLFFRVTQNKKNFTPHKKKKDALF